MIPKNPKIQAFHGSGTMEPLLTKPLYYSNLYIPCNVLPFHKINFKTLCIHSILSCKKRSYKKRLVNSLCSKKRRLVDFYILRNAFLKRLFKIIWLRNDCIKIWLLRRCPFPKISYQKT